ncbi:ABC transporter permease subunit (plasmid) [Haloferax mediterranei ATCC 33500]|uniref:ABC transporter permease subunit n=1 Tax=Haloferax mediterranei (strain ATCC 33500 / DSM 1411 / JCM 8866 / NBRC 14739 / NCIMB 2177 / R-4) TaxID=523841 RepID=I3RAE6_HALMT|nr:ABC transporter permease subunit [Haloferax mediterranei]AFK21206.1 ABC-type transport system permease protein [Haloferax mediterranei ATCC 33500]AHZ24684.1 sulfate ABC transporter permease [Haloferax mediterranei ATCC 33500]ELZ97460.1 ABC-type transport system permease [Haloferax mediterranei ATCC 33500]MDX5990249.1 ABC transporter permease subunit [Haloferax mediterranei ATCC 33500]QCQ76684.1 ABC transporter permease subunit [Haloferax mediterranei ATCC 33500]
MTTDGEHGFERIATQKTGIQWTEWRRERVRILLLCLPFAVLAITAGVVPLWEMAKISVSESQFVTGGFTLDAYETLVTDPYYRSVAVNTIWFAVATTLGSLAVAVPVAHALEKYDLPAKGALVTVISFPNSLPGIVAAFMIIVLLGNSGVLTNLFAVFSGRAPTSLAVATSVFGLYVAYLYSMVPRSLLLLRGTYAEINTDAEAAARSLGATPWQTFRYVTFPQIRSGVVGAGILTFRTALAIFGTVLILKAISPPVWTLQINRELANGFDIQMASAMATVWFVFVFAATFLGLRLTDAEVSI